jgi:hypothetical protein
MNTQYSGEIIRVGALEALLYMYGHTFIHPCGPFRPTTVRTSYTACVSAIRLLQPSTTLPYQSINKNDLLDYIEACVAELGRDFPAASIALAGDLNQLTDQDLEERTGLTQMVHQWTRGNSILDRVHVSNPQLYSIVRVVASVVKSDHRAVVVYADQTQCAQMTKKTFQRTFLSKTQTQHALFLQHIATMQQENLNNNMLNSFPPQTADTI